MGKQIDLSAVAECAASIDFDTALAILAVHAKPLDAAVVSFDAAGGCYLGAPVYARIDSPRRYCVATDGYAVRDHDLTDIVVMQPETDGKRKTGGLGCGLPFCSTGADCRLDSSQHKQGTLALDLVERATRRLATRATSKHRVTGNDVAEAKLTARLRDMTKALPTT